MREDVHVYKKLLVHVMSVYKQVVMPRHHVTSPTSHPTLPRSHISIQIAVMLMFLYVADPMLAFIKVTLSARRVLSDSYTE